jgi:HAD superfamily hydrolase (TIGR01509 family)
MKIEAVILDFDGTVVDSEPIWKVVQQRIFTDLGYPIPRDVLEAGSGLGFEVWMKYTCDNLHITNLDTDKVAKQMLEEVYAEIIENANLHSGFHELTKVVKENDLPYAICTASEFEMLLPTLDRLDIKKHFNVLHSAHGYENMKPHPEPYLLTAEKLGIDIKNCVVIEDSIPGITAGVASGAKTFGIPSSYDLERASLLGATIVNDLSVVANYIQENL